MIPGNTTNLFKIIQLIGSDSEKAVIRKRAMNCIEKIRSNDSPATVAPFGPGIGEQQIKCFDRCFRQEIANSIRAFDVYNPDIFQCGRFMACLGYAPDQTFHPEKVFVGITLRQFP